MADSVDILLGKSGLIAVVDMEDYQLVSSYNWFAKRGYQTWYAMGWVDSRQIFMHRFLLSALGDQLVDHKSGNGLDNRRENLRICSHAENRRNRRKVVNATSRFKGVSWLPKQRRWQVRISVDGKTVQIGCFGDECEAAGAYDRAAKKYHGEFALLNFPEQIK